MRVYSPVVDVGLEGPRDDDVDDDEQIDAREQVVEP